MIRGPFFKKCPAIGYVLMLLPMLNELKTMARNQRKAMKRTVTCKGRKPSAIACT